MVAAWTFRKVPTGIAGRAFRLSGLVGFAVLAMLPLAAPADAAAPGESDSAITTTNVVLLDRLSLMKFSDIDIDGAALPAGGHATLELLPGGPLVTDNGATLPAQNSFSAVFTLAGTPNQTFGISLPGAITLTGGGTTQSVRTFLHDAGRVPVLADTGRGRFHVGAVLSVGRTGNKKTEVYIGAFDVIVSNN